MTDFETQNRSNSAPGLPMVVGTSTPRPSLRRSETTAAFVSQLLAARENLPAQRLRRRNSVENALGAYGAGARMGVVRMPVGYRKTVVV